MTPTLSLPLAVPHGRPLKNRIVKSAMSERLGTAQGAPSEALVQLYRTWAAGGTGLLITGNVMVDRTALGEEGNVVIEDARHLSALSAWARAASEHGAQVWMQLNHPGRQSPRHLSPKPVAPSAIGVAGAGPAFAEPRALTEPEILSIVERFATAAEVADRAGFHGVQVHGAHGYLVSQFLSPLVNQRSDRWGGSLANRVRFLLAIVEQIRARTSPDFAVGVKLNSADFQRGGFSKGDSKMVVALLEQAGIDMLEISGGTYEATAMWDGAGESTRRREAYFLDYAEEVRASTQLPLLVTGGFRTAAGIQEALLTEAVDLIGLARPLAVEPDLSNRLLDGTAQRAIPLELRTGIKNLDSVVVGAWYGAQLRRLGRGLAAKPGMWRLTAVLTYFMPQRQVAPSETVAAASAAA
jgi:2,4-dienoyl-CoA reductase-like NADH-dependent reductase (Old Yellow Enzyme family)